MWNKFIHFAIGAAIITMAFLVVAGGGVLLSYYYYWSKPVTDWGEYHSLSPVSENITIGEPLWINSESNFKLAGLKVKWNDILRCRHSSAQYYYGFYSSYVSSTTIKEPTNNADKRPWKYGGRLPDSPKICVLESQMDFCGPFKICKSYSKTSSKINFIE